jgi:hypothetical protein
MEGSCEHGNETSGSVKCWKGFYRTKWTCILSGRLFFSEVIESISVETGSVGLRGILLEEPYFGYHWSNITASLYSTQIAILDLLKRLGTRKFIQDEMYRVF